MPVFFHKEDSPLPSELRQGNWKSWLHRVANSHKRRIAALNYIFCSDHFLLDINQEYLQHDTYTDIVTFDYSDVVGEIEGDIYISVDRVKENAEKYKVTFREELARVRAHGLLHLCGFGDKTPAEKLVMRREENLALGLFRA
jgi:rRNA maturation RNase YbeY